MAGKDLSEAIKIKAVDYKNIGNEYFKKGNYKNAIKSYKNALHLDSTNPDIWNNLGLAYLINREIQGSEEMPGCNRFFKGIEGAGLFFEMS